MKRILTISFATLMIGFALTAAAFAQNTSQSLGDYARSVRKSKSAPAPAAQKTYDNDNLPTAASVSVVGNSSAETPSPSDAKNANDASAPPKAADGNGDKKNEPQVKPGQSLDERKQAFDAWKKRLADQNEKIAALSHELDMAQREYRVKAAEFYADTANRAQNPTGFAKADADYKQQIADKQKALDEAKAKLSELQEEARKAGAPSSVAEQN